MGIFNGIFGGKPWYQSWTARGAAVLGVVFTAEQFGLVEPGTSNQISEGLVAAGGEITQGTNVYANHFAEIANAAGALLVILGLRKAAN